jgi:hypothetical protein
VGPTSLPQARLVPHHLQPRDDPVTAVSCILNAFSIVYSELLPDSKYFQSSVRN